MVFSSLQLTHAHALFLGLALPGAYALWKNRLPIPTTLTSAIVCGLSMAFLPGAPESVMSQFGVAAAVFTAGILLRFVQSDIGGGVVWAVSLIALWLPLSDFFEALFWGLMASGVWSLVVLGVNNITIKDRLPNWIPMAGILLLVAIMPYGVELFDFVHNNEAPPLIDMSQDIGLRR